MFTSRFACLFPKKIILTILSLSVALCLSAQKYYISSSLGSDLNNGLSIQTPFKSIEKLNSMMCMVEILSLLSMVLVIKHLF